jgi:hypothetical protein
MRTCPPTTHHERRDIHRELVSADGADRPQRAGWELAHHVHELVDGRRRSTAYSEHHLEPIRWLDQAALDETLRCLDETALETLDLRLDAMSLHLVRERLEKGW